MLHVLLFTGAALAFLDFSTSASPSRRWQDLIVVAICVAGLVALKVAS